MKRISSNLEESNPVMTEKFTKAEQNFYRTCFQDVEEWSETNITGSNSFFWCFMTSSQERGAAFSIFARGGKTARAGPAPSSETVEFKMCSTEPWGSTGHTSVP
ncbi:hypothetical protein TNCV_230801 [Trichonephila clavipes]|nr:hypothetical protein TNCV_230801 [Trichonephila clavipes]